MSKGKQQKLSELRFYYKYITQNKHESNHLMSTGERQQLRTITNYYSLSGVIKTRITRRTRSIKIAAVTAAFVVSIPGGEISSFGRGNIVGHKPWYKYGRRQVDKEAYHQVELEVRASLRLLEVPWGPDHRVVPVEEKTHKVSDRHKLVTIIKCFWTRTIRDKMRHWKGKLQCLPLC